MYTTQFKHRRSRLNTPPRNNLLDTQLLLNEMFQIEGLVVENVAKLHNFNKTPKD